MSKAIKSDPPTHCDLCPRLVSYRQKNRVENPNWFNGAVPSFGPTDAALLIVGLAPGINGANRTSRPFTGDHAGDLLYSTLAQYGFSNGTYGRRVNDGLKLVNCRITNAVRCVPPKNKPLGAEINTCRKFLAGELFRATRPKAILALGHIAHNSILRTLELRKASFPFTHCAKHEVGRDLILYDSYHCSRYNTNTGRLTREMFNAVFSMIRANLFKQ